MRKLGFLSNGMPTLDVTDVEGGLLGEGLLERRSNGEPVQVAWWPNGERHHLAGHEAREIGEAMIWLGAVADFINHELY